MTHEISQDLGSALAIVLQQLDKEVKGLIERASTSGDAGSADLEYPLILAHYVLRKQAESNVPCLKKIIAQINSSEHTARRALGGVANLSGESSSSLSQSDSEPELESTAASSVSASDGGRNSNEAAPLNEAETPVITDRVYNNPCVMEEDTVMAENQDNTDDSEDPSSTGISHRLRARMGTDVAVTLPPRSTREFVCPFCDKKLSTKQSLTNHVNLHTGSKPFKCNFPGCGATFSHDNYLYTHKSLHERVGASQNMMVDSDIDNKANVARLIRVEETATCDSTSMSSAATVPVPMTVKTEPGLLSPDLRATTSYPSPNLSPITLSSPSSSSTFITPPYSYSSPFGPARPLQSFPALSICGGEANLSVRVHRF